VVRPSTLEGPFSLRPGAIDDAVAQLPGGDPGLTSALQRLLAQADDALTARPASVVDKPKPGLGQVAARDVRDYVSMAPYFWPDPEKRDGLPYVRRDGQLNPEAFDPRYDKRRLMDAMRHIETLALAYRFTGKDVYAECCARHLRTWFTDQATRMNPHLDYAQVVPGTSTGRRFGVLDGHFLLPAFDAAWLLRGFSDWSDRDQRLLREWAAEFLRWLRTSKSGKGEARSLNNHGTFYDLQVVHLALVVSDLDLARRTAEGAASRRIAGQIRADGSQPHELSRAEPFYYLQYNLMALFMLATRAEHAGVDLWRYETDQGAGIRKALDFVVAHLENPSMPWPYEGEREEWPPFYAVLSQAGRVYGDARYVNLQSRDPGRDTWELVDLIR
jgi:alginate lyase